MPKVKIIRTAPIAEDGIHVRKYSVGWQGEVSDVAAQLLTSLGAAIIIRERMPLPVEPEVKPEILPTEGREILKPSERKRPSSMRIWQLADEIGTSSARIIEIAKSLGIKASVPMSNLSMEEISNIKSRLEKLKR